MRRILVIALLALCGCTVISANRVFPTVAWYWSKAAKLEREERAAAKAYDAALASSNTLPARPITK